MSNEEIKNLITANKSNFWKIIKLQNPELFDKINGLDGKSFSEKLYFYLNNGLRGVCKNCGKSTKFIGINRGYREFCSNKCVNSSLEIKNRIISVYKLKYGVENISQSDSVKQNKRIRFQEKHGVSSPVELPEVKEKCLLFTKRYISDNRDTILERLKRDRRKAFISQCFNGERLGNDIIPLFDINSFTAISDRNLKFQCKKCKNIFHHHLKWGVIPICWRCNPKSLFQMDVIKFVESLGVGVRFNVRNIIKGELDIFVEDKRVAIECNGIYWHSCLKKDRFYHLNKTIQCEKIGIKLIHLFEGELKSGEEIIRNNLFSIPVEFHNNSSDDILVDRGLYNRVCLGEMGLEIIGYMLPEKKIFGKYECWDCGAFKI